MSEQIELRSVVMGEALGDENIVLNRGPRCPREAGRTCEGCPNLREALSQVSNSIYMEEEAREIARDQKLCPPGVELLIPIRYAIDEDRIRW